MLSQLSHSGVRQGSVDKGSQGGDKGRMEADGRAVGIHHPVPLIWAAPPSPWLGAQVGQPATPARILSF